MVPDLPTGAGQPRRDAAARAALAEIARRVRPVGAAHERVVEVPGSLGARLPQRGVRRGSVVAVTGAPGAGATSVALTLAGAVTARGEWAAALDLGGTLGALAAAEAGVALERFVVVRPPGGARALADRWATVVAALLDGVGLVIAELPRSLRTADARRLAARARERAAILVPLAPTDAWPAEAALRLHAPGGPWPLVDGLLTERTVPVVVDGHGAGAITGARAGAITGAGAPGGRGTGHARAG
ncbi:MAG: hypothetical protein FJW77_13560 [Actinobacteria bacterium]|nr:hypothetical protein [Actinomycetota bacterium]